MSDSVSDEQNKPPPPPAAPPPPAPPQKPPAAPSKSPSDQTPAQERKTTRKRPPSASQLPLPGVPKRKPKGKPKRKRGRRPQPKKGKPGQPPVGEKKGRRIKIKLGLRAKKLSDDVDSYTDQVGWTTSSSETILGDLKDMGEDVKKEPETLLHHCSMCGSRMEIPKPKRERYKVICAHPECGHEDQIGF